MKRKEDADKNMGQPMFPRLHINDTEKGGPRAPPRNKMALYEQLTTPSQSYISAGAVLCNPTPTNNCDLIPSTSRNQEMDLGRRMHLPVHQLPLPAPTYSHDELRVDRPETVNLSNQPTQVENRKKSVEEDDVVVPVFSHHGAGQCTGTTKNGGDAERGASQRANHPMMLLNHGNENANHSGGDLSRQHVMDEGRCNLRIYDAPKGYSDVSGREKDGLHQGQLDKCLLSNSEKTEVCSNKDVDNSLPALETRFGEGPSDQPPEDFNKDNTLRMKDTSFECKYANGVNKEMSFDCLLERGNVDRDDDVSETSMVDSALNISAEDVVGIIGVKHFLKARSAIASQQRLLAAQVFELHRLLKVQGLIAESPQLLLEGSGFVDTTSRKDSNVKKYSSDFAVKTFTHTNRKDSSQVPKDKLECSAENVVSKVHPVSAPTSLSPVNTDPKMNPWSLHQPSLHQWLVPVMCPSEGLVYKPCPVPGFTGPVFGGYGPVGPYGGPQGIHYGGQGCFPPYGMPVMNPSVSGSVMDQMTKSFQPDPYGQMDRPAGGSTKSSCNGPIQKNNKITHAQYVELQRSTASSPSEQAHGPRTAHMVKGTEAPPLPASSITDISCRAPSAETRSRVIRVVPRDRGSTRESAARIFQSIQEERKHLSN